MAPKSFLSLVSGGNSVFGAYIMLPSILSAHIVGSAKFDWVLIDMEHSPLAPLDATNIVQAIAVGSHNKTVPLIRIPCHGVEYVKWALDSGAAGIIVPMVQSKVEMYNIIRYAKYPPLGQRSFGPFNAPYADLDADSTMEKYFTRTAKDIAILPMIESVQGVNNVEDIVSVPGVTGLFVGPVDLRLSMNLAGTHGEEPQYLEALEKISNAASKLKVPVGIFAAEPTSITILENIGYSFFLVSGDVMGLSNGVTKSLAKARKASQCKI